MEASVKFSVENHEELLRDAQEKLRLTEEKLKESEQERLQELLRLSEMESIAYLFVNGLPELKGGVLSRNTTPSSSRISRYEPATVTRQPFEVLESIEVYATCSAVLSSVNSKRRSPLAPLSFSSERDIQVHVENVVQDMIKAANLSDSLYLTQELSMTGLRPDVMTIKSNGSSRTPVCCIEVKLPRREGADTTRDFFSSTELGQLFNYIAISATVKSLEF